MKGEFEDIISGIESLVPKDPAVTKIKTAPRVQKDTSAPDMPLGKVLLAKSFDTGLIKNLEVKSWGAHFNFYDDFMRFAIAYADTHGEECEYVHFFSFTPQYSHMTKKQTFFYLYFRDCVREGKYIRTDFSYILLYIYEILNLPTDKLDPKTGLIRLAKIWAGYRQSYPQLDKYLSEWIPDYCLIHSLPLPVDIIRPFMPEVLRRTSFPEFYLNSLTPGDAYIEYLIAESGTDYRLDRSYVKAPDEFDKHMHGAIENCRALTKSDFETVSAVRDSYIGALCLFANKRRMTVTYTKISDDMPKSNEIAGCVRYAYELTKSGMGIRSKNTAASIPDYLRTDIEAYFSGNISEFRGRTKELDEIADKRYEPTSKGFSREEAEKIELLSRSAAELLEGAEEPEEISVKEEKPKNEQKPSKEELDAIERGEKLSVTAKNALSLIYDGKSDVFDRFAREKNILPEALIEEINYYAYMTIGDIAVECDEDGNYTVVTDYKKDVEEWLKK